MKPSSIEPTTIEVSRVVVEFASFVRSNPERDIYPIGVETTLAITQDQDAETGKTSWSCINGFSWWYSQIGQLCHKRACRVEAGDLLPNGIRMKPETYLGLWRQAKAQALSFEQMIERGLLLVATVRQPTAFCNDMKASEHKEHQTFAQRLASPHIEMSNDHETVWRIPLNSLDNLLDYNAVNRWHNGDKYPGEFNNSLDIEYATPVPKTAQAVIHMPLVQDQQIHLFSEAP